MGGLNPGDQAFCFCFSRLLYPGIVTFVIASFTFPPGMGQFMAGEVSRKGVWGGVRSLRSRWGLSSAWPGGKGEAAQLSLGLLRMCTFGQG